ncbi:MAG: DUF3822 family protein [Salibacteraceae bacterium]|nr:DUF3822 family protein [Salibacteraceae bacterium]
MTLKPTVTGNKLSAQTLDSTQHYYDTSLAIEPASLQYLLLELDQNKLKSCAYHLTKNKVVGFSILPLVGIENNLLKTLKSESKLNQDFEQTILAVRTNNYTLVPRTYLGNDFETVFKLTNSFDTEHEVLLNHPMVNLRANVLYAIPKKEHEAIKSSFSRLALIPHIAPRIEHQLNHNSRSKGDRMVIHSNGDWLDILVFKDHELILSNCFYIASKEDVAYYTLFCAEALQLDTEAHLMIISGAIKAKDETHDLLSKYWQNIEPASLLHNATVSDHFPSYPTTELDYLTQSLLCAL